MSINSERELCFFCGAKDTITIDEHYIFCKRCTALYTEMIVIERNCEHIGEDAIVAEREPWFRDLRKECRDNKAYILPNAGRCSICNSITIADGW